MKIILLGSAGAGKSTLCKKLIAKQPASSLSLDAVAFQGDVTRRSLEESIKDVQLWIADNDSWVIEGCYSDIIEPILGYCDELIFLNPGIEACVAHCRSRPWEPEKFNSREEQDENLDNLIQWVRSYETRKDEYGLSRHRALYESFLGNKREYTQSSEYESVYKGQAQGPPPH